MPVTLATDLDRTLFPNGTQPADAVAMPLFRRLIREKAIPLIFVTGRNRLQIEDGIRRYETPVPGHAVAEVGTRIYRQEGDGFVEDLAFVEFIGQHTHNWDREGFQATLASLPLRPQPEENQNPFKLSYYVDGLDNTEALIREAEKRLEGLCPDVHLIWSVDETENLGLLDVLPRRANKLEALEYLRRKNDVATEDIVYCGDSGNDLLPLAHGYRSILVANATDEVRDTVRREAAKNNTLDRVYLARGDRHRSLNGHYVSGILEGLLHFGVISESDLTAC